MMKITQNIVALIYHITHMSYKLYYYEIFIAVSEISYHKINFESYSQQSINFEYIKHQSISEPH